MASTAKSTAKNGRATDTDISIEDLSAQIDILKADIASLTDALGTYTKAKGAEASEYAKTKARETARAGREKAVEAQLHAEDFVRNQPATALGIAAGVGFLVGMFTARR
ncbi:YqjD family protein [Marimonas sp. MJW-29]|uniref:YqjD family protein n=1 Tax=Sulfitobacter sediminis TaxID=3234186 RepID=A0ABV3RGB9_9RHOB